MASLSSSFINVGVNMVLRDQFSQNAGRVTDAFRTMMNNLSSAGRAVQASYGEVFDAAMSGAKGVFGAYKAYANVEKDIFLTGKMAGATHDQIKELRDLAESTNLEVPLTTGDIASAERFLAMAGNSVDQIKAMIPAVSKLSSIFGMEAGGKGGVADLMTNIMSTYQLPADQVKQVANDLFVATTNANMDLRDLANSIKYSGAEMATMGYSVRETAAAIGLLGDMGIQGSMAGTALANTMRYLRQSLSGQKESGANALARLGLSLEDFTDARGELVDLYTVYKTLAKAVQDSGISGREGADLITAITGVRGSRNMLAVIRQLNSGNDTYAKIMNAYNARQGALDQTMEEYQESPQGRLDKFKSTLDAIQQRLGQFAADFLNPFMDSVNWILAQFFKLSDIPVVGWIMKSGLFLTFVSPLVVGVKMMRALVVSLRETILMTQMTLNRMGLSAKTMAQNMAYSQMMMGKAAALSPGQKLAIANGAYMGMGRTGKMYLSYTDAAGKRHRSTNPQFMQNWLVSQNNPRGGNGSQTGQRNTFANWFPKGSGFSGAMKGMGRGLLKVGGAIAGLAGGPIGIGLMAATTLLPSLIDAIRGNTSAQEEERKRKEEEERQRMEELRNNPQLYQARRDRALADALKKIYGDSVNAVNITVDGVPVANLMGGDNYQLDLFQTFGIANFNP